MKIGISSIGYNSYDLLAKCFNSWNNIKNSHDIKICFSHGCFVETYQLNYPIYSEDGTHELAKELHNRGVIDDLRIYDTPQLENEMWTNNFLLLKDKYDIDLLIMVNVDEIWQENEIEKILEFVSSSKSVDFLKINFKNYCIDYNTWVDDFIVPRIWFTQKNTGLKRFYQDDLVEYNDGKKDVQCPSLIVPKEIVFPKHYSWVGDKEYLLRKLKFQQLRYGLCSYTWDYISDKLCLNEEYYFRYNIPKPKLNIDR